jgi:hypothetical protein
MIFGFCEMAIFVGSKNKDVEKGRGTEDFFPFHKISPGF